MIVRGDCIEEMAKLEEASVDSICCDPPYLLAFMGKEFDSQDGAHADPRKAQEWHYRWACEALRVLKPGGHLLAFGGTRTSHRLACALEDAGFEIRDTICYLYGSGFPKSLDVSKAIDKAAGAERSEVVGVKPGHEQFVGRTDAHAAGGRSDGWERPWRSDADAVARSHEQLAPATEQAARWQGWGTALKPAHEPIVVARKPLAGTVAANVLEHGTGALNIDAARIAAAGGSPSQERREGKVPVGDYNGWKVTSREGYGEQRPGEALGRWPANVALGHSESCQLVGTREVGSNGHYPATRPASATEGGPAGHSGQEGLEERRTAGELAEVWECAPDCPVRLLDAQSGEAGAAAPVRGTEPSQPFGGVAYGDMDGRLEGSFFGDRGGASRFFYTAKAGRAERNAGLGPEFAAADRSGEMLSAKKVRECKVCGSRAKRAGPDPEPWPTCGHGDWEWVHEHRFVGRCTCETPSEWVNADPAPSTPPASGTRPPRATTEPSSTDDSGSSTTSSGSESAGRSPRASRSTTSTETSRTTNSGTSPSSPTSSTSAVTRPTTDEPQTEAGSAAAASAASGSPPPPSTSTSPERDTSPTDAAGPATSARSSQRSASGERRCASCGGVVRVEVRNFHPT